jgi:hypothetical protein
MHTWLSHASGGTSVVRMSGDELSLAVLMMSAASMSQSVTNCYKLLQTVTVAAFVWIYAMISRLPCHVSDI